MFWFLASRPNGNAPFGKKGKGNDGATGAAKQTDGGAMALDATDGSSRRENNVDFLGNEANEGFSNDFNEPR